MPKRNYRCADLFAPNLHINTGYSTKRERPWGPDGVIYTHGLVFVVEGRGRYLDETGAISPWGLVTCSAYFGLRHQFGPEPDQLWREAFCDIFGAGLLPMLEAQGVLIANIRCYSPALLLHVRSCV